MNETSGFSAQDLEIAMNENAPEPASDEVAIWMFFRTLKASGLLPAACVEELERRAGTLPFAAFQRAILDEGLLTEYQLTRVLDGNGRGLAIGQYRILGELGRGGCGLVYKARHALMDRVVAIKVVGKDLANSTYARDMFVREVIASTRLNHPNIAGAYHADEYDGQVFFVLEFVDGPTLQAVIEAGGPVSVPLACTLLLETAQALQHAHELGIVHRDIKPANIMLPGLNRSSGGSATATVKVVDFGLARIGAGDAINRTIPCHDGALVGTPAFMAPEQINNVHAVDIRSDLYSLGCTIYHAIVGRQPFNGCSTEATLYLHLHEEATPVRDLRPQIPAGLAGIVHRLMEKEPAKRFQTPAELLEAVNDFILSGNMCDGVDCSRHAPAAPSEDRSSVDIFNPGCSALGPPAAPVVDLQLAPSEPYDYATEATVGRLWAEWYSLVQCLAEGRSANCSSRRYRDLYRVLLRTIRERSGTANPFGRIESLVEPWVTLESLAGLEYSVLENLWNEARELDDEVWQDDVPASSSWLEKFVGRVFR